MIENFAVVALYYFVLATLVIFADTVYGYFNGQLQQTLRKGGWPLYCNKIAVFYFSPALLIVVLGRRCLDPTSVGPQRFL
jgi:hypothetical protein